MASCLHSCFTFVCSSCSVARTTTKSPLHQCAVLAANAEVKGIRVNYCSGSCHANIWYAVYFYAKGWNKSGTHKYYGSSKLTFYIFSHPRSRIKLARCNVLDAPRIFLRCRLFPFHASSIHSKSIIVAYNVALLRPCSPEISYRPRPNHALAGCHVYAHNYTFKL